MRTRIAWIVVCLQVGVLAFMGGEREWILRTGRTLLLRTAPVDPRDPMRGDYVRFDFEIAHVPKALCRDGTLAWFARQKPWAERELMRDEVVFAQVKRDDHGVAELVAVSDRRPAAGEYLRGRTEYVDSYTLHVRFGVEALFTEQGKAREFEEQQRQRPGVPLNIEAAVSESGVAVLKGYRWEPLGITVTPDRAAQPRPAPGSAPREAPSLTGVTVQLKNHSDQPVAIVVRPNGGSFRLVPVERPLGLDGDRLYRWAGESTPLVQPTADMVKLLRPGETHQEHIDFSRPEWWLREEKAGKDGNQRIPWDKLKDAWGVMFRVEYAPPEKTEAAGFPHAEFLRYGRLRSRAFGAMGAVD